MEDITDLMAHYRICAREIWNRAFWPIPDLRNWDARDRFDALNQQLLEALVYDQLEWKGDGPPSIQVRLKSEYCPIQIENPRPGDRNHYWDHPLTHLPDEYELQFDSFFDFDHMNYADFQYCFVSIKSLPAYPELVGRNALIAHAYSHYFHVS